MNKRDIKSGDDGWARFANGKKVKKSSDTIELNGYVDELNVSLGCVIESFGDNERFHNLFKKIYHIQRELLELGLYLFTTGKITINPHKISKLESEIDAMNVDLPILKSPMIPSGGENALRIYLARAVCRHAERIAFKLVASDKNAEVVGVYFNRLGDWLHAAARTTALISNIEETVL